MIEELDSVNTSTLLEYRGTGHINPTVKVYAARSNGYLIPYIGITRWPSVGDGSYRQVYWQDGWWVQPVGPDDVEGMLEDFKPLWVWTVTVDNRLAFDFTDQKSMEQALRLLADGMAVAAGYTAHGYGNRLNPHGPALAPVAVSDSPASDV